MKEYTSYLFSHNVTSSFVQHMVKQHAILGQRKFKIFCKIFHPDLDQKKQGSLHSFFLFVCLFCFVCFFFFFFFNIETGVRNIESAKTFKRQRLLPKLYLSQNFGNFLYFSLILSNVPRIFFNNSGNINNKNDSRTCPKNVKAMCIWRWIRQLSMYIFT